MAGDHHDVLRHDPAIERWATMRETTLKYFKWTPRTVGISIFWGAVVPVGIYELIVYANVGGNLEMFISLLQHQKDAANGTPQRKYPSFFS